MTVVSYFIKLRVIRPIYNWDNSSPWTQTVYRSSHSSLANSLENCCNRPVTTHPYESASCCMVISYTQISCIIAKVEGNTDTDPPQWHQESDMKNL